MEKPDGQAGGADTADGKQLSTVKTGPVVRIPRLGRAGTLWPSASIAEPPV